MSSKMSPVFSTILGLFLLVAASACSSTTNTAGGTVSGVKCATTADCSGNMICSTTAKVCIAKECDDLKGPQCPAGKKCVANICTATTFPQNDAIGGGDSSGADATSGDDSTVSPQDSTTPPPDTSVPVGDDKSCGECKVDSDCGGDFQCIPLLNGSFCSKKCTADGDCKAGYQCQKASSGADTQKNCVLPSFSCNGCAVTGCDAGKKCNLKLNPPSCDAVKAQCEECLQDKDCDTGFVCTKMGPSKICAPSCAGGKSCPDKSTCQTFVTGQVCAFQAASCCYGSSCTVACSGCADNPAKCLGGVCVECATDNDCKAPGKCNVNTHTCTTDTACPAEKPIKLAATGACVECSNDTNCGASANGPKCNLTTYTCEKTSGVADCAPCAGTAYPDCVQVNGTWSCVECQTDKTCADKSKGVCSPTSYTCSGTIGGGGTPVKPTTKCKGDGDCVNGPDTTFTLACDIPTGTCYDTLGKCDNIVAFCAADAGSTCDFASNILSGLGGGAGGIPGVPGGTGTNPVGNTGSCTCGSASTGGGGTGGATGMKADCTTGPLAALIKMTLPNCTDAACNADPNTPDCNGALGSCCAAASSGGGGTGGLPIDPNCLASMMGGGGSTGGTPDPACFGGACTPANCLLAMMGGGAGASASSGSCSASPF